MIMANGGEACKLSGPDRCVAALMKLSDLRGRWGVSGALRGGRGGGTGAAGADGRPRGHVLVIDAEAGCCLHNSLICNTPEICQITSQKIDPAQVRLLRRSAVSKHLRKSIF